MWLIRLALRNALRNTRRTALTATTILLGTALLTIGVSWVNGILGDMLDSVAGLLGEVRLVTPAYLEREALNPLYENIPQSGPVVAALEAEGVRAYPMIRTGAVVSVGEEIGEDFAIVLGAERAYFTEVLDLDQKLSAGSIPAELGQQCLIGSRLAQDLGAGPGAELLLLGQTQDGSLSPILATVAAVVEAGNAVGNRQVYLDLERARYMADIPEGALEILIYSDSAVQQSADLAARLRAVPALEPYAVQAWLERPPFNEFLPLINAVMGILIGSIVFIAALGVLNTMLMSVLERTAEIGVMRAMGLSGPAAVALFVLEAAGIGLIGAVLGAALGGLGATWMETHGLNMGDRVLKDIAMPVSTTLYADFTPSVALGAVALGVLMAVLGALLPSVRAAGIQPVDAMRSRR